MKNVLQKRIATMLLGTLLVLPVLAKQQADDVTSWDFNVYLDDKRVGTHRFEVSEAEGTKYVQSEASFTYRILFIPAYQYDHTAAERWTDNCLVEFDASTNTNGKELRVSGEQSDEGFVVDKGDKALSLPDCVMTFAYWNPDFLHQSRLLNPQTGEYVEVSVEEIGGETFKVRGVQVPATRFKLTANKIDLTLWYSSDNEWLGLESVAKGGRVIRYELS